jgi:alpha-N-acetylglucosamine transferase
MENFALTQDVYLKNKEKQKMIELITISKTANNWYLNKVIVNSSHIITITEARDHDNMLREGKIDLALDNNISFSKVRMNPMTGYDEVIVIGDPSTIMEKMNRNTKQLLKG